MMRSKTTTKPTPHPTKKTRFESITGYQDRVRAMGEDVHLSTPPKQRKHENSIGDEGGWGSGCGPETEDWKV